MEGQIAITGAQLLIAFGASGSVILFLFGGWMKEKDGRRADNEASAAARLTDSITSNSELTKMIIDGTAATNRQATAMEAMINQARN